MTRYETSEIYLDTKQVKSCFVSRWLKSFCVLGGYFTIKLNFEVFNVNFRVSEMTEITNDNVKESAWFNI